MKQTEVLTIVGDRAQDIYHAAWSINDRTTRYKIIIIVLNEINKYLYSLCNLAFVLHDTVCDYIHLLCDCVCLCVFCRSDGASFYVVTWKLKVNSSLCVWGCRDIALFVLNLGCG